MSLLYKYKSGGNVFPHGGPVEPYFPKSVKDHTYRKGMYEDSLSLHNAYTFQKNNWKPGYEDWLTKVGSWYTGGKEKLRTDRERNLGKPGTQYKGSDYEKTYYNESDEGLDPMKPSERVITDRYRELIKNNPSSFRISYHSSPDLWHKSIKPVGTYMEGHLSPIYKKPVQEIADVNTVDSLPVKSVLNSPRSYPELAVSNFDGVKKSVPTPYPMSGRQQTVFTSAISCTGFL